MKRWAQLVGATMQLCSESVEREWYSAEEWRKKSRVPEPFFSEASSLVEAYAAKPLFRQVVELRDDVRLLAKQVREELDRLLRGLEPVHALALLCQLPSAASLGYSWDRLGMALQVKTAQLQEWERLAYVQMQGALSERTPFLRYLAEQAGEWQEAVAPQEEREMLLQAARTQVEFDVRAHVSAAQELVIRQALHREGLHEREQVKTLFAEQDAFAVELLAERMMLEMYGEEGRGHA